MDTTPVTVIGLGRFGTSLASELVRCGVEVLGVDSNEKIVREHANDYTDCVIADSTDPEALRQLGLDEAQRIVVAIGGHLEASILTASNVVEMNVPDIWAKADSDKHARILEQIGVHHVIRPERDTGRRVAHLLGGRFQDFAEVDDNYGVSKLSPPPCVLGKPWDPESLWRNRQVQIVSVRRGNGEWQPAVPGMEFAPDDLIVAAGAPAKLEAFTQSRRGVR